MIYYLVYSKNKFIKYFFGIVYLLVNSLVFVPVFIYVLSLLLKKINYKSAYSLSHCKKKILIITSYALSYDGRVKNCINFFQSKNFDVILLKPEDCADDANSPSMGSYICQSGFCRSFLFFPYSFDIKMFCTILKHSSNFVHCHDISSSFMGLMAKAFNKKIFLIVDFHEWWSESVAINNVSGIVKRLPFLKRKVYKFIESLLIKHADCLITVSEPVADMLNDQSGNKKKFIIAKNFPSVSKHFDKSLDIRQILNIPKDFLVVYYVGQLGHHRRVDIFIKALKYCPNVVLVFRVTGHDFFENFYSLLIREMGCADRIYFLPPVFPEQVVNSCLGADLGLNCGFMDSKNMQVALPNKLFEYTLAGIPILSVYNKSINEIVSKKKIGATFKDENSVDEVIFFINKINNDKVFYSQLKNNVLDYKKEIQNYLPYEELSTNLPLQEI